MGKRRTKLRRKRTGCDVLTRFDILERKPGEKVNSYWSRFKGFYQDNRIKKDDKLMTDNKKATEDEKQCRFSKSTELAIFLHMTHPMLPRKMAQIFAYKLKTQDLASLQDQVLDRCQSLLDELEGSHAAVNRMNYQQQRHNSKVQNSISSKNPQTSRELLLPVCEGWQTRRTHPLPEAMSPTPQERERPMDKSIR